MLKRRRLAAVGGVAILGLIAVPTFAHPLGNFTINHYSAIHAQAQGLSIRYILDMAEIPTFQEVAQLDEPGIERHIQQRLVDWVRGLRLTMDDTMSPITLTSARIACLPGVGGLPTLRVEADLSAGFSDISAPGSGSGQIVHVVYQDTNFAARQGWKEIVVVGQEVQASSVPAVDRGSHQLRLYPVDLLSSPPGDAEARFTVLLARERAVAVRSVAVSSRITFDLAICLRSRQVAGGTSAGPSASRPQTGEVTAFGALFTRVSEGQLNTRVLIVALLGAFALGAYHALTPGHGKTILAAYFIGIRGTSVQAVLLGAVTTLTHTIGVFVLGIVTLFASRYVLPEKLYPWLSVLSGAMLAGVGISLLRRRLQNLRRVADRPNHAHHHRQPYTHEHLHADHHDEHHHDLPPGEVVRARDLVTLGITGGLLPCPSALVVMLAAISVRQVAFGLVLITAFSIGLAAVLTTGGLLMVYARGVMIGLVERTNDRGPFAWLAFLRPALRCLPVASAAVVALIGLAIIVRMIPSLSAGP